jgi:uncharacterized membrane protein
VRTEALAEDRTDVVKARRSGQQRLCVDRFEVVEDWLGISAARVLGEATNRIGNRWLERIPIVAVA